MIYLTDEISLTADSIQYIVGKPVQRPGKGVEMQNPKYYHKLSAALQQAVTDCVRAGVADERIPSCAKSWRNRPGLNRSSARS